MERGGWSGGRKKEGQEVLDMMHYGSGQPYPETSNLSISDKLESVWLSERAYK